MHICGVRGLPDTLLRQGRFIFTVCALWLRLLGAVAEAGSMHVYGTVDGVCRNVILGSMAFIVLVSALVFVEA